MIAPNAQRHAVARVGEAQLAVRFLFACDLGSDAFDLNMHPRFHGRAVLRMSANFTKTK
jgi:hypothetical protein